ncbi:hypothetical protein Aduo_007215 [Ancylostoma duodenale]
MTSLSSQLHSLRTATAQHQTVERKHVSLLFEKAEAQTLDREAAFQIGCAGLQKLKQLDAVFQTPNDLFDESRLHFQRSMITKEDNAVLNEKIEKLLFHLSPYLQHFACQQVLEWLVFKYQIYSYNAEAMILTFLPFHETNFFGRMLSIIEYNFTTSKDWGFLEEFCKKRYPVPFTAILKSTLSSTHSLITKISEHINKGLQLVGDEFLEGKCHMLFTFYAKLLVYVLEESAKINDVLLSKVIPLVAVGLKSTLPSFRQASLMVICKLATSVKLTTDVVASLVKVIFMKFRKSSLESSLSTLIVLCQQQTVDSFSIKATLKTLRNESELELWHLVRDFSTKTDLTCFLKALWTSLFSIIAEDSYASDHKECLRALRETTDSEILCGPQAMFFLSKLLEYADRDVLYKNKKFCKRVTSIVARFSDQWMELHSEWTSRDETVLASVVQHYQLENFAVIVPQPEARKKRMRRRSNSMRKSISETVAVNKLSIEESAAVRAEEMAASSEFARRQSFSGDPIRKAREWIKNEDWDNAIWAFDEMNTRKAYFANKATEDVEDFVLEIVKLAVRSSKSPILGAARLAFAEVNFRADFVVNLLSRHEVAEPNAKKAKSTNSGDMFFEAFHSETADDYGRRLIFVIDMLVNTTTFAVDARIFSILFGLIKEFGDGNDGVTMRVVNLLLKALKSPGKYKISSADLKMDFVVEMMRTTHSHHILRDSLRLLTAAVRVSPASVTSHVMSVFTFMGNGLLRKDNELTLRIIEDTLEALFRAVCEEDGKTLPTEMRLRLIGVARVFAASVCDIPAHRRARMAHTIARAVKHINVWIVVGVLLEHFCARWQRSAGDANKRSAEQDAFEDFALELFVGLDPILQLSAAVDLVEFIVRLGSDNPSESAPEILDQTIFDRSKYSIPKLRHFRFVTIGLVVKILSNRKLYERLGAIDDALLYQSMLPIGKRLMTASVELGEFVDKENAAADQGSEPQTVRYWVALSSRAETVSEKLRHLMPGGVAARIITDILEDEKTDWRMREKALQLANLKLIHDGFFFSESGINEEHLERMAVVLNKWLVKERLDREKIILCQNAAFTLKLVAKRLSCRTDSSTLAETIGKCTNMVADYQTLDECMVGNALLLAGELIRSHNMRTTMVSAIPLLKTCLSILNECSLSQQNLQDPSNQPEDASGKRRRVRQQSLSGKKLGSSTLLICALTCTQRILDQFAPFVSQFIPEILVQFCRLCGRYCDSDSKANANPIERSHPLQTLSSIQHRLTLIRAALLKLEVRVIGEHFAKAVVQISGEEKPLIALFALLRSFFDQKNRVTITQIRNSLVSDVFIKGLEYRAHDRNVEDVDRIANVEQSVFSSLLAMAEVLTENTLRSVVNTLVDWAEQGLKPAATREERGRLITVFMFANSFYDSFNSLALPYFGKLIEMSVKVLNSCNATILTDPSLLLLHGKKDTMDGKEADCLVTEIIDFVGNCARHREFFTEDRAESLVVPLTNEIVNSKLAGHEKRCVPHLANTLYRISDTHPDVFQTVLDKALLKTRNGRAKIRYRALLVVEAIFDKVGDGVAPHLPMVMPFLSELLEDENRNVEEQCDRVVRLLQSKFGENICEGFA